MKRTLHILFITLFLSFACINGMEPVISTDTEASELNQIRTIVYFACYYCKSKEKNTLMRLDKKFYECLKMLKDQLEVSLFQHTYAGNLFMISFLLRNGVRINGTNLLRMTLFHNTDHHNEEVMSWLPKYREDAKISNCTQEKIQKKCVHSLPIHPLYQAVDAGNENAIKDLLELQEDPNLVFTGGDKCLFTALRKGYIAIVHLLINAGANVNQRDADGWTPLCAASYKGYIETVQLLLHKGANIYQTISTDSIEDTIIKKGDTPLLIAQLKGHDLVAKLLQEQLEYNMITKLEYNHRQSVLRSYK